MNWTYTPPAKPISWIDVYHVKDPARRKAIYKMLESIYDTHIIEFRPPKVGEQFLSNVDFCNLCTATESLAPQINPRFVIIPKPDPLKYSYTITPSDVYGIDGVNKAINLVKEYDDLEICDFRPPQKTDYTWIDYSNLPEFPFIVNHNLTDLIPKTAKFILRKKLSFDEWCQL